MSKKILVVEDEEEIRNYIRDVVEEHGYIVATAEDGAQGLSMVQKFMPDLIVLDLGLPKISGEALCREVKKNSPDLPVIMLSARDRSQDVLQGFSLGADDYVTKPFIGEELVARIHARLKDNKKDVVLKVDGLTLDPTTFVVTRDDKPLNLTPTEFKLLEYLMKNAGQILTREMILSKIWQSSPDIETRVVDVYIGYLRKKVDGKFSKKLIKSSRGFGYTIKE